MCLFFLSFFLPSISTFLDDNGGFLLTSPDDTRSNLPDLAIDDIHTACDESVNCLLTTDRPDPDFFPEGTRLLNYYLFLNETHLLPRYVQVQC